MIKNTLTKRFDSLSLPVLLAGWFYVTGASAQNVATDFTPSGISGGGRILSVTLNPEVPEKALAVCDMMGVYRTEDEGLSWRLIPTDRFAASARTRMQYAGSGTNQRIYGIKRRVWGSNKTRPAMSADGGMTWSELAEPPNPSEVDQYYSMVVDPASTSAATQRLVVDNYTKLWFSATGGASWTQIHQRSGSNPESVRLAGVAWDGQTIYVATNVGMFRSTNGGVNWNAYSVPGLPGGSQIVEFCGAKAGVAGAMTLFATVIDSLGSFSNGSGKVEGWMNQYEVDEVDRYLGLFTVEVTGGSPAWVSRLSPIGLPFARIDVPPFNSARPWAATSRNVSGNNLGGIYKGEVSGTAWAWTRSLEGGTASGDNVAVSTGYQGDGAILSWDWSYPTLGLDVSDSNPDRVIVSGDLPYLTENGGSSWMQMFVNPATENAAGLSIPRPKAYHHSGLGVTTGHWLHWVSPDVMLGANTDVGLQRSPDGGVTWTTDYTPTNPNGLDTGNWYAMAKQPGTNRIYAALASINDFYEVDRLSDLEAVTGKSGDLRYSDDGGISWTPIVGTSSGLPGGKFPGPVVNVSVDTANPAHIYVSCAHAENVPLGLPWGGIYRSTNGGASWIKLPNPTGTQGRPLSIHVIGANELVTTFCARQDANGAHTASSGVFHSTDGGTTWVSRSASGLAMAYYTRDLVVDPANSQRWFVAVQSTRTNTDNANPTYDLHGGVYRTDDKGATWTKIFTDLNVQTVNGTAQPVNVGVQSVTYVPGQTPLLYVTTFNAGLWVSSNPNVGTPTFSRVTNFPFARTRRVFVDPYRTDGTIWVTTQGGGLWRGTVRPTMTSSLLRNGVTMDFRVDVNEPVVAAPTLMGIPELPTPSLGGAWTNLGLAPTVSTPSAGITRYTWTGVQSHTLFAGLNGGFVRAIRTRADGTNETGETGGWVLESLVTSQTESWGVPWLKPLLHRARAVTLGNTLKLDVPYPSVYASGRQYYVEIEEGTAAGHRVEVDEALSGASGAWVIDVAHTRNTTSSLPMLNGERVALREHWTLGEAFPTAQFQGTNSPATADTIRWWDGVNFLGYWRFKAGSIERWVTVGDSSFADQSTRIVPPGEGFLLELRPAGASRTLPGFGMVRQGVFRHPMTLGKQFYSLGYPVGLSFASNHLMLADGFTATNNFATADGVQIWQGDGTPWVTGYKGYWYFGVPPFTVHYWSVNGDNSIPNVTNNTVFPKQRGFFIEARTVAKPFRRVLPPWIP